MGRKKTSVYVSKEIIENRLKEKGWSKAYLASKTGYHRESVSRAISSESMDKEMLRRISKEFNCYASDLQGVTDMHWDYDELDDAWDDSTVYFRKWLKAIGNQIKILPHDLPVGFCDKTPNYSLADFIKESEVNAKVDKEELFGITDDTKDKYLIRIDDSIDALAGEVMRFLHDYIVSIYYLDHPELNQKKGQ